MNDDPRAEAAAALHRFGDAVIRSIAEHAVGVWCVVLLVAAAGFFAEPYLHQAGIVKPAEHESLAVSIVVAVVSLLVLGVVLYAIHREYAPRRGARPR